MARSYWLLGKLVTFQALLKGLREFLIGLTRPSHGS